MNFLKMLAGLFVIPLLFPLVAACADPPGAPAAPAAAPSEPKTSAQQRANVEQQIKAVEGELAAFVQEQQTFMGNARSQYRAVSSIVAQAAAEDPDIARIRDRLKAMATEQATLQEDLKKRLEGNPAYKQFSDQSRADMDKMAKMRERQRDLIEKRNTLTGDLWRLRKLEAEEAKKAAAESGKAD